MKLLNQLAIDEEAIVCQVLCKNRRLKDLGLVEGTKIKRVLRSPLGDPSAYRFRGSVIAIRKEEASQIKVRVKHDE